MLRMIGILVEVVLISLVAQNPTHDGHVENSAAGVDFTYHSQVDRTSDNKFILRNYIKNNSSSPLSVQWIDGGITCIGTRQLPPTNTAYGKESGRIVENPANIHSVIKYGATLNYSAPAEVYIDPQRKTAKSESRYQENVDQTRETTFEIRDGQNSLVYSIKVVSTLKKSGMSELTFEVQGGLSLALAIDTRQHLAGQKGWSFGEPIALQDLRFTNKIMDQSILEWFKADGDEAIPDFFVLKNPGNDPIDFIGTVAGGGDGKLRLKRINIIGFFPNQQGFVGFSAAVYLPKDMKVK